MGGIENIPASAFIRISDVALGHTFTKPRELMVRNISGTVGSSIPDVVFEINYRHQVITLKLKMCCPNIQSVEVPRPDRITKRFPKSTSPLLRFLKKYLYLEVHSPGTPPPYLEVRVLAEST